MTATAIEISAGSNAPALDHHPSLHLVGPWPEHGLQRRHAIGRWHQRAAARPARPRHGPLRTVPPSSTSDEPGSAPLDEQRAPIGVMTEQAHRARARPTPAAPPPRAPTPGAGAAPSARRRAPSDRRRSRRHPGDVPARLERRTDVEVPRRRPPRRRGPAAAPATTRPPSPSQRTIVTASLAGIDLDPSPAPTAMRSRYRAPPTLTGWHASGWASAS